MVWSPIYPIKYLPDEIKSYYIDEAEYLLNDLEVNKLRVVLIPAPRPMHQMHMIRVAESYNPEWYSSLYWSNDHFRRDYSLKALNRIIKQKDRQFNGHAYRYDLIYRELIHERLTEGFFERGFRVPPNEFVGDFFNVVSLETCLEEIDEPYLSESYLYF